MEKEDNFALPILTGQLFIYCLKCNEQELLNLYPKLKKHIEKTDGVDVTIMLDNAFSLFLDKFKTRYSLADEAVTLLRQKFIAVVQRLSVKDDCAEELASLKIADAWSGLTGALRMNTVPCTLLDYFLEMILPFYITEDELALLRTNIGNVLADDNTSINAIDICLGQIADRLCFGGGTEELRKNELKLAILLHLPLLDSALGVKAGFVFKMLKITYEKECA